MYITVDGNRALTTCGYRVDYEFLSGINVSANEDVRLSRLICDRVGLDGPVPVEFDLCPLEESLMVGLLTDTEYDIFALNRLCPGIVELRIESSFAVLDAQALSEVDAANLAFFVLEDLCLSPAGVEFDSVALAEFLILPAHRHFFVGFKAV